MKKKDLEANQEYLQENGIFIPDYAVWDEYPDSRELFLRTDSGGDFSICVEELTREEVLNMLNGFDVNEEVKIWWGGRGVPFDNIRDLYEDIYQWRKDFIQIAEGIPY